MSLSHIQISMRTSIRQAAWTHGDTACMGPAVTVCVVLTHQACLPGLTVATGQNVRHKHAAHASVTMHTNTNRLL